MQLIISFIFNYIKTRITAELLKKLAGLLIAEAVKRTELKTDDAALDLYNAIEDGTKEEQEAAIAKLVDSLGIDANKLFSKK